MTVAEKRRKKAVGNIGEFLKAQSAEKIRRDSSLTIVSTVTLFHLFTIGTTQQKNPT